MHVALSLVKHPKNLIRPKVMQSARSSVDKDLDGLLQRVATNPGMPSSHKPMTRSHKTRQSKKLK